MKPTPKPKAKPIKKPGVMDYVKAADKAMSDRMPKDFQRMHKKKGAK